MRSADEDLCPCGSGLPREACCFREGPHEEIMALLREAEATRQFESIEELRAFLADLTSGMNTQPREMFEGLSSEQVYKLLYRPYDSPDVLTFPSVLATPPSAPVLTLFGLLVDAIGSAGVKATATGKLPRKLVQEAFDAYAEHLDELERRIAFPVQKEMDFRDLHYTRVVAGAAGLVRKYKGRFIVGRECQKLLDKHGMAGIYPRLLRAFTQRYNWCYADRYPEIPFIQRSFAYTLYLLDAYGDEWRPNAFYEDAFLGAFPDVLAEVPESTYETPVDKLRGCYSLRCFRRFVGFMGLGEVTPEPGGLLERRYMVRKLPLLNKAVIFHAGAGR